MRDASSLVFDAIVVHSLLLGDLHLEDSCVGELKSAEIWEVDNWAIVDLPLESIVVWLDVMQTERDTGLRYAEIGRGIFPSWKYLNDFSCDQMKQLDGLAADVRWVWSTRALTRDQHLQVG